MAKATKQELTNMVVNAIQGELDLTDRLYDAGAGRHELYLSSLSADGTSAVYDLFVRGTSGKRATVAVRIDVKLV